MYKKNNIILERKSQLMMIVERSKHVLCQTERSCSFLNIKYSFYSDGITLSFDFRSRVIMMMMMMS